jgi:hypothetical protein
VTDAGRVQQQQRQLRKKPGEEEMSSIYFHERMTVEAVIQTSSRGEKEMSNIWSSKAMIESLEEVCRDIAWGERREIGRIGLALQDHICSDLIEEIAREMGSCGMDALPFEACCSLIEYKYVFALNIFFNAIYLFSFYWVRPQQVILYTLPSVTPSHQSLCYGDHTT